MIRGTVAQLGEKLLLMIFLEIEDSNGDFQDIPALIDTGNDFDLVMSRNRLSELGLEFDEVRTISVRGVHGKSDSSVCRAHVIWDGDHRQIRIIEGDTPALVGQGLLKDYSCYIEMREGGTILLQRLPSSVEQP